MAIPVINPNTSVLAPYIGESWGYQPTATNTPTSWAEVIPLYVFTADSGADTIAITGADFSVGQRVRVSSSGTLPAPLTASGYYYCLAGGQLAATLGGTAIDLTDTGSGTHSIAPSALPPGLVLNLVSGLISGVPTVRGFYEVTLKAHNADGDSAVFVFPIGVRPARALLDAAIGLQWDWPSNRVTTQSGSALDPVMMDDGKTAVTPLLAIKNEDQLQLALQFVAGGLAFAPAVVALTAGLKREDEELLYARTSGAFLPKGSGPDARYYITLDLTVTPTGGIAPINILNDYATDGNDIVLTWMELRLAYQVETSAGVYEILRRASQSFPVALDRSLLV